MSSVGYASSSLYSNMFSPSILTWPPSLYVSLEVRPCEWKYTSKKSWPVVGCQRATTSARFRCLGNGPTVAEPPMTFQVFGSYLGHASLYLLMNVEMLLFSVSGTSGWRTWLLAWRFGCLFH
ncbi:hypothetical protein TNCV_4850561 [Trichonephila clavipes]|nr:hypothetical protein TNCV_4850561 [Trichonephila clavipes]